VPAAERVSIVPSAPDAERSQVWIRKVPSKRVQAKIASPPASPAICSEPANWPAAERVWVALSVPPAERVRAWMRALAGLALTKNLPHFPKFRR
jgi:hypothetical protein